MQDFDQLCDLTVMEELVFVAHTVQMNMKLVKCQRQLDLLMSIFSLIEANWRSFLNDCTVISLLFCSESEMRVYSLSERREVDLDIDSLFF